MLTPSDARERLYAFAEVVVHDRTHEYADGEAWLLARSAREWLLLDESARSFSATSHSPPIIGVNGWLGTNLVEATGFVATVTSLHSDGRIRQRATKVLVEHPCPLSAPALALRCLDHASQVREEAVSGLVARTNLDEVQAILSVLLTARGRWQAPPVIAEYTAAVFNHNEPSDLLGTLRASTDRTVRRWAFETAHIQGLLSTDELVAIVAGESDQFIRGTATDWLGAVASHDQLLQLVTARYGDGRILALLKLADEELTDATLLALLSDPSTRVRDTARWRAGRRGLDVAATFRDWLTHPEDRPRRRASALDGIAAVGSSDDVELVASFLDDTSPSARVAAVRAVAVLADAPSARERLVPHLVDPSPRVASAAARALLRAGTGPRDADDAWLSSQPWSRRAAWLLTRGSGGWERVAADVRAANDGDQALASLGRSGVRNWLWWAAATTWGTPSATLLAQITDGLTGAGLTPTEEREIAFHCGIKSVGRWTQAPAPPGDEDASRQHAKGLRARLRLISRRR